MTDRSRSQSTATTRAGAHQPAPRRKLHPAFALALVSTAQLVLQLDFSIVNVALPKIQAELHFAAADLQWIVTGYALTFGSLLLLGGRLGDIVGRRRLLLGGLVLFALTSLSAGLAQGSVWLVASRILQGASAAMVAPSALAMISDLYEEGPERTRALGIFQGATAGGATAGIVLGGLLTQYVGWRAIFLVNPPVIAILVTLMVRLLPADTPRDRRAGRGNGRIDAPGALLVTGSIAALIFGLSRGQQHGFGDPLAIAALCVAAVLAVAFVPVERRISNPMVSFEVLADPTRRMALGVMLLCGAVLAGYVYFISLYMQRVLHFSAAVTGVGLLPSTLTIMTMSMLVARRLLARLPAAPLLFFALIALGGGQVWLSRMVAGGSYALNVVGGLVLTGIGVGLIFPIASVLVTARMPAQLRGLAGGLFVTAQQVGQAVGLAVLATVAASQTRAAHGSLVSGYRLAYVVSVGFVAAALAIVAVTSGLISRRGRRAPQTG